MRETHHLFLLITVLAFLCPQQAMTQSNVIPLDSTSAISHASAFCQFYDDGAQDDLSETRAHLIWLKDFPAVPILPLDEDVAIWKVSFTRRVLQYAGRCGRPLDFHLYLRKRDGAMLGIAVLDTNGVFNEDSGRVDLARCVLGLLRSKGAEQFHYVTVPPKVPLSKTSSLSGFCGIPESYAGLVHYVSHDGSSESAWALIGMNQRPIMLQPGDSSRVSQTTLIDANSGKRGPLVSGGSCREEQ